MHLERKPSFSSRLVLAINHLAFHVAALALLVAAGSVVAAESWPDFRGPHGDGHVAAADDKSIGIPLHWSESKNIKWKTEIPLLGLSSPVVMDGQVWLTTATEEGQDYFVLGVDAATGKMLANEKLFHRTDPEPLGNGSRDNSYATPSAVAEPGRVYVHFGSPGTACLDTATKKVIWKRDDLKCRHYRGASSSPILFGDLLILTFDGVDLQYHVALDKRTGKTVWQMNRSVKWNDEHIDKQLVKDGDWRKAHSTPLIVNWKGQPLMFSAGAKAAYGYDPGTGAELWRVEHESYSTAPRPVFRDGHFFFVTGFSSGAQMWSVKAGGKGVVTDTHVDWRLDTPIPKYSSPIVVDDLLYLSMDDAFLACVEAETGNPVWKERVGGRFRACPIYADGRLYFFSLEGVTTVIRPGRTFEVLATNTLADNAPNDDPRRGPGFMASPAVIGKALIVRIRHHLYRIEND
ncbi:MAG: PQQ-binding-like beta-propeller repeat protein [Verrucomicrobia bacterium]|nr:PQQ-binding-like beta-propeller repeat protein [Verrucomicrobiota bacterium]